MAKLLSCVLGPRLYRVYRERSPARTRRLRAEPDDGSQSSLDPSWESYYQPRTLEKHADSILALASVLWSISYYSSPLAVFYLYRKGYLTMPKVVAISHYAGTMLLLLAGIACLRGIGRWTNPQYIQFITILEDAHRYGTPEHKVRVAGYLLFMLRMKLKSLAIRAVPPPLHLPAIQARGLYLHQLLVIAASIYSRYEVEDDWCLSVLKSYQAEDGDEFPWSVGEDMTLDGRRQLALFLARKHLQNFEATHCTPLPPQEFHLPWSL
ncbi:PREDICTED: abhydrolase domain-containing protein 16A-like [Thamnophis sirtalis]|uniref:Abhydrolase domain-containing protein 16A-like n=1 Tax=Thamnophis sirtalis TaxID=35019 RepID=A0A6I9YIL4_9SAUR|nr:PREDICTED: abhydrolase domain-containing protein 16A-like [Thamnophis sirtalis]